MNKDFLNSCPWAGVFVVLWIKHPLHDKKRAFHDIFPFSESSCHIITMNKEDKGDFAMDTKNHTEFSTPPIGSEVSRFDHCPCFSARRSLLATEPICWFCRFAKFDLFADKLPERGVCKHPVEQTENEKK
jgi:hypothetical protein